MLHPGHETVVQFLLDNDGYDANKSNALGKGAFMEAISNRHTGVAQLSAE